MRYLISSHRDLQLVLLRILEVKEIILLEDRKVTLLEVPSSTGLLEEERRLDEMKFP